MDPVILDELRKAYESERLIVFVGAGVSAGARLPGWKKLAEALYRRAEGAGADPAALAEMKALLQKDKLLDAISAAEDVLREDFVRAVRDELNDTGRAPPEAAKAIAALGPRLRAVITTNLDRLLERAFGGEWPEVTEPPGDLAQDRHYILKMHGTLRDAKTWVLTRAQYDRAMFASTPLQRTIGSLYRTHPFLFVGFGLEDDNIELTLAEVRAHAAGQPPTHYAILPKSEVGPQRRRDLGAAGLRLLLYENAHGDHREVVEALRSLAAPAGPPVPAGVGPAPTPPAAAGTSASPALNTAPAVPVPAPAAGPIEVFLCYARGDVELLERLESHLGLLRRQGLISAWHAGLVGEGEEIGEAIRERLEAAQIILLLVSAQFLASEEHDVQVARAMERRASGARVVPILLRPCDWETSRFGALKPILEKPVTKWSDPEEAFAQIAAALRKTAQALRPGRRG